MIELIKDASKLESTCYFEFLPGVYKKECWNKESVFIYYLHIPYIEPILEKFIDNYDHYSFMSVDKTTWQDIIVELNTEKDILRNSNNFDEFTSQLSFSFRDIEDSFTKDFEESKVDLIKLIEDLVLWIRDILKHHKKIAILGM